MANHRTWASSAADGRNWLVVATAAIFLVAVFLWSGWSNELGYGSTFKWSLHALARGAGEAPVLAYAFAGAIIGVASTFAAGTVLRSVFVSLPGIAAILFPSVALALVDTYADGTGNLPLIGKMIGFVVMVVISALTAGIAAILGCATASILLNLTAALTDPDHQHWLVDRDDYDAPNDPAWDMRIGGAIVAITALLCLWGPVSSLFESKEEELVFDPTPVVAPLDSSIPSPKGVSPTRASNERTRFEKERFDREYAEAIAGKCDRRARSWLKTGLNSHFKKIPKTEKWRPGLPVTEITAHVILVTSNAMANGLVTWDELSPYGRVHLDEAKLADASRQARARLLALPECQNYQPKKKQTFEDIQQELKRNMPAQ